MPKPSLLFMTTAGASTAACLTAIVVSPLLASALAGVSAIVALGGLAVERQPRSPASEALLRQAAASAEAGRKLAMYERETGLLAHWYLSLRGKEECARAARYGRPLTMLLAEPEAEANTWAVQGQLVDWARGKLRFVDIAGYVGNGRFVVMMPETDIVGAREIAARLAKEVGGVQTSLSAYGAHGTTFEDMYMAAVQSLHESAASAA
jgi:GGDEF domain-containing protein